MSYQKKFIYIFRLDSDIPYVYDRFEKITFDTPSSQRYDWSEVR